MIKKRKCRVCGGKMEDNGKGVYFCPDCRDIDWDDDMPYCCQACGGNYPECMSSCTIFDDD